MITNFNNTFGAWNLLHWIHLEIHLPFLCFASVYVRKKWQMTKVKFYFKVQLNGQLLVMYLLFLTSHFQLKRSRKSFMCHAWRMEIATWGCWGYQVVIILLWTHRTFWSQPLRIAMEIHVKMVQTSSIFLWLSLLCICLYVSLISAQEHSFTKLFYDKVSWPPCLLHYEHSYKFIIFLCNSLEKM